MHIPPGVDEFGHRGFWRDDFIDEFAKVTGSYRDILRDGYAGHTHEDEFRVLADSNGAYLAVHMAPSVTPWRNTWPAFTIFAYDTTDGNAVNYWTYRLRGGSQGGSSANWDPPVYSFYGAYHAYGIDNYDRANLDALARKIDPVPFKSQNQVCEDFMTYFNYDGSTATSCSRSKACALNNISSAAYGQCNP
jgi:hypothetical protein